MKTIYVIGVFDLFHTGHVELLRRSKEMGDKLIVAINGDDMVALYKRKPYLNEDERLAVVKACRYVDDAFIIKEYDNKKYLKQYNIDVIVHGDDWDADSYMEQIRVTKDFLIENNITIEFLPYTRGISTSELIRKIKED